MSLRYAAFRHCDPCGKGTPHTAMGRCVICRASQRRAKRRVKLCNQGKPLARYGDLLKIADDVWSVWVRAFHPGCEYCGAQLPPTALQNAHGVSREDRSIRFDPNNMFSLDSGCHRSQTPPKGDWDSHCERMLTARGLDGSAWAAVKSRSRSHKLTTDTLLLLILDAQLRIAALPDGDRKSWALESERKITERMVRLGVRAA